MVADQEKPVSPLINTDDTDQKSKMGETCAKLGLPQRIISACREGRSLA